MYDIDTPTERSKSQIEKGPAKRPSQESSLILGSLLKPYICNLVLKFQRHFCD